MRHLKTQQQLNEATEKLNISGVISRLLSLQRIDIHTHNKVYKKVFYKGRYKF